MENQVNAVKVVAMAVVPTDVAHAMAVAVSAAKADVMKTVAKAGVIVPTAPTE